MQWRCWHGGVGDEEEEGADDEDGEGAELDEVISTAHFYYYLEKEAPCGPGVIPTSP